jgi:hypothetical protein
LAVAFPAILAWPATLGDFLDLYDWDKIVVDKPASLSSRLDLCVGIFPCSLNVQGVGLVSAMAVAGGSIRCLASAGCSTVVLDSLLFHCQPPGAGEPVLWLHGSSLVLHNATVAGCSSASDGGFIFAYGEASVLISSSTFKNMYTLGRGSILMAAGSTVLIADSDFINCSAANGGGVLCATAFICTGSQDIVQTQVHIDSSRFTSCKSPSSGGAVLISAEASNSNSVALYARTSIFKGCSTNMYGGAIHASGPLATVELQDSEFVGCRAETGGAISVQGLFQVLVVQSVFKENEAVGRGGGGIYSKGGTMVLVGLLSDANSAPMGGGGVILWDGAAPPVLAPYCPEGSWGNSDHGTSAQFCTQCAQGTYQTGRGMLEEWSCAACPAGAYNNLTGKSHCLSCPAGKFSTGTGGRNLEACELCSVGTFSSSPATSCLSCPAGSFANTTGASFCLRCLSVNRIGNSSCYSNSTFSALDPAPPVLNESRFLSLPASNRKLAPRMQIKGSMRSEKGTFLPRISATARDKHCSYPKAALKKTPLASETLKADKRKRHLSLIGARKLLQMPGLSGHAMGLHQTSHLIPCVVYESGNFLRCIRKSTQMRVDLEAASLIGSSRWCGMRNSALYGNCIASSFKRLDVLNPILPVYPGISFGFAVQKVDAYNQTILTDSNSVLQVHSSPSSAPHLSIIGAVIVQLQAGIAEFKIALKPSFARIDGNLKISDLAHTPEIFVEGLDSSESGQDRRMVSDKFVVPVHIGDKVCPLGYILNLDFPVGNARFGTCTFCTEGTYSLDPLFGGSETANPACVSCPLQALQSNDCTKGGGAVNFTLGNWRVSNGMYKLVGCPAGYQMINAVGGLFSNQIQQCSRCGPDEYILDSSNTNYSCKPCPKFLICNGIHIENRYSGATVAVDYNVGLYLLSGCPAGFEVSSDQQDCTICAPLFYCTGGIAAKLQCPQETFSPTGSNSSNYCVSSVFVNFVVLLSISMQDFDIVNQEKFILSVAKATRMDTNRVIIVSVTPSSTRRDVGVDIQTRVAVTDKSMVSMVVSGLNQATLNDALVANGLQKGQIQKVTVGNDVIVVIGGLSAGEVAGVVFAFLVLAAGLRAVWLRYQRNESDDERHLRLEIVALRKRLYLCKQDGFYLSYEAGPLWRRRDQTIFILRNEMEAAARLSLLQDFDVKSFDAFCHCIEYSDLILHRGRFEQANSSSYQCDALYDWLLETCRILIEPVALQSRRGGQQPATNDDLEKGGKDECEQGSARQRFMYFKQRVAQARVWINHDRLLWHRLKRIAADYMDNISLICDTRFDQ